MSQAGQIPHDFVPGTEAEMAACLADPLWRVCSGQLYKIMVKTPGETGESVADFRPNRAQRRFMARLWHRNIILKARQLGFTTLIAVLWLDHALFNADQRCVIVAQDREKAEEIFRDKVVFAYERLPEAIRSAVTVKTQNKSEILFSNNSAVRVSTSARGGTPHRLHVSEMGKIGAQHPIKAREIVTGSIPAVPLDGVVVIESTAEGQEGHFYDMAQAAMADAEKGKDLTARDYRFHFFPWWREPGYRMAPDGVLITAKDHQYFDGIEAAQGTRLDLEQRAWYVATRDGADFGGDPELMWQEYPSTPQEAFQTSTEGHYYAAQLAAARKAGRITAVPHIDGVPVNTFWDIGSGDGTGIWLHQQVGLQDRFIGYLEGWEMPYSHFVAELQKTGYIWGTHHLPHDAQNRRQQGEVVAAPIDELSRMGLGGRWVIVPRVQDLQTGIQATRQAFSRAWFDAVGCKEGLLHLAGYKKRWNKAAGCWSDEPLKNIHTEGADSFRQWPQGWVQPAEQDQDERRRRANNRNWKTR